MKTSSLIPYIPITIVVDFLMKPMEISYVDDSTGVPRLVTKPNPAYWVSDIAMDRAHKIRRENDSALAEAKKKLLERPTSGR